MSDKKTHWKRLVNPDYIGAYALNPGEDLTVTIKQVVRELVTQTGGKKEECTVAHLVGQKPLILNATNSKTIAKLFGPYIEDWAGQSITLYASMTNFGKEMVECLRIRSVVPDRVIVKQPLSPERFANALAKVNAGQFSRDKLLNDYALTEEQVTAISEPPTEAAQ